MSVKFEVRVKGRMTDFWCVAGDVESIFKKGEEGMKEADGFIAQMVRHRATAFPILSRKAQELILWEN